MKRIFAVLVAILGLAVVAHAAVGAACDDDWDCADDELCEDGVCEKFTCCCAPAAMLLVLAGAVVSSGNRHSG